ncbi:MAG: hypothetical protein MUF00_08365 [Gemmatimonadaceae bacterium]|nr:hypothetical protein [Gemmatimonadaceae bacterium]
MIRLAGTLYLSAAIAFVAVFSYLAQQLGYPELLDRPAAEVLPALLAAGGAARAAWAVYALLPLLLLPAATLSAPAMRGAYRGDDGVVALLTGLQWVAGLSMMAGLLRWSTVQWELASRWVTADATGRATLATHFDLLNVYLGNGLGEFVGELALYSSFVLMGVAMRRTGWSRIVAWCAWVTGAAGLVGAFRNITSVVQPVADVVNGLLPLFLVMLGVALWRRRGPLDSPLRGSLGATGGCGSLGATRRADR